MSLVLMLVGIVLSVVAGGLLALAALLLIQVMAARLTQRSGAPLPEPAQRPRMAVLMPAHNEAGGIEAAVKAVVAQLSSGDRLIVIADNCSDDTAAVAGAAGAQALVRTDTSRRGKGYALDFGVRALEADPPDVVVIVDADCLVHAGALGRVNAEAAALGRPVQSSYLMRAPAGSSLKLRFAEFAWTFKTHVRASGYQRLGLPCQLQGSGMAFPWAIIQRAPLASGHIVEDLQLGLDLAREGTPPLFCPAAQVSSEFPVNVQGLTAQRTRWEHGHLATILSNAPGLLGQAVAQRNIGLAALALDLCVPPLAFMVMLIVATTVVSGIAMWRGVAPLALTLSLLSLVTLGFAVGLAWSRFGRDSLSLRELLTVPLYVLQKASIYRKFFGSRQVEWVRTERD